MKKENIAKMTQITKELEKKCIELNEKGQPLFITAIYDKRAEQYNNIMTVPNKAFAVRGFIDAVKDENGHLYKYAEDFKLVCIGVMNQKTGEILQNELETLVEAASVVVKK